MYWERFYNNANGWHQQFPAIKAFTFDNVSAGSLVAKLFTRMKLLPHERPGYRDNAHLAAMGEMFHLNAKSTWYLQVDDDTIVVKQNLDRMIAELEQRGDVNETEYFMGKCVYEETDFGDVHFAVGGSGILMNHKALGQLAPKIEECRREYADSVTCGDARIGACLSYTLNISTEICPPKGYSMTNQGINGLLGQPPNNLIVTLHEKNVETIKKINEAISNLSQNPMPPQGITWQVLYEYLAEQEGKALKSRGVNDTTFEVGDRVIANWRMRGHYYAGVVANVSFADRTVSVKYDDDGTLEVLPHEAVMDRSMSFT